MRKLFSSIALFFTCGMLYGQTGSLSLSTAGSAASSVTLNVSLAFSGAGPSELLWTVTYPSGSHFDNGCAGRGGYERG